MALKPSIQVQIHDPNKMRANIEQALFHASLNDHDYDALAGICLDGVNLTVSFNYDLTGVLFPLRLRANRGNDFSTAILFNNEIVTLHSMSVGPALQGQGIGWETFFHQAKTAAARGFTVIRAKALRFAADSIQGMHDGYYRATRWGFNAAIPQLLVQHLPAELAGVNRLSDLMGSQVGMEFWREHGATIDIEFPLVGDPVAWERLGVPPGC